MQYVNYTHIVIKPSDVESMQGHQGDYFILYFLVERWVANAVT